MAGTTVTVQRAAANWQLYFDGFSFTGTLIVPEGIRKDTSTPRQT